LRDKLLESIEQWETDKSKMLGDCHVLETVGGASKEKSFGFGRVNQPRLDPGDYPFE